MKTGRRTKMSSHTANPLFEACGESEPDGASMRIVEGVWDKIHAHDAGISESDRH
jgi:hypothetical protein